MGSRKLGFAGLAFSLILLVGCNTSWIATAIQLIQVATPIITNLTVAANSLSGNTISPEDVDRIRSTAQDVTVLLGEANSLSIQYRANPDAATLVKIDSVLQTAAADLGNLMPALHIKDDGTRAKIAGGIAFAILAVEGIQAILPVVGKPKLKVEKAVDAGDLKAKFNRLMREPTSNAAVNTAFAAAVIQ